MNEGYSCRFPDYRYGVEWSYLRELLEDPGFVVVGRWSTLMSALVLLLCDVRSHSSAVCTDTPDTTRPRSLLKSFLRDSWLQWVFSSVSTVLTTGEPGCEALVDMGCPPSKLVNFPFFVDLDFFDPGEKESDPSGAIRIISSGRLKNRDKGFDRAIRALAEARDNGLTNFVYEVAGTGPDLADLQELSVQLNLEDRVSFLGWKEPDELRDLYHAADVLLHPAPTHDPFPVTVLEGMAAGLPILGSRAAGSVRDRVEHGVSGLIHEPGDVEQLAEQLRELPRRNLAGMGKKARATAEEWPVERGVSILKDRLASLE